MATMPSYARTSKSEDRGSSVTKRKGRPKKWAGSPLREALVLDIFTDLNNQEVLQSVYGSEKGTRSLQCWRKQILGTGFRRWRSRDKAHMHDRISHLNDQDRPGSSLGVFSLDTAEVQPRQHFPEISQPSSAHGQLGSDSQVEYNRITFRLIQNKSSGDTDPDIRIRLGKTWAKNMPGISYTCKISEVSQTLDRIWREFMSESCHNKLPSWLAIFSYIDLESYPLLHQDHLFKLLCDKAAKIALNNCRLTAIPKVMQSFSSLKYINLQRNRLCAISSAWLPNSLIHLDLRHNQIVELPSDLLKLGSLKILAISHNQIKELPAWISSWNSLQLLYADGNPLTPQSYMYYHCAFQYCKEESKHESCFSCLILATKALKEQLAIPSTNVKCGPLCSRCSQEKISPDATPIAGSAQKDASIANELSVSSEYVRDVADLKTFINRISMMTDTTRNSTSTRTIMSMSSTGGRESCPRLDMQAVMLARCCFREAEDSRDRCIHVQVGRWIDDWETRAHKGEELPLRLSPQDLSSVDFEGNTFLHIAASFGASAEALLRLISLGCQPDTTNLDGETFLHRVGNGDWSSQDLNVVRLLVHLWKNRFCFEHRDNRGNTIFHKSEQLRGAFRGIPYLPDYVQKCQFKKNAAGMLIGARSVTTTNHTLVRFACCVQRRDSSSDTAQLCFDKADSSAMGATKCTDQCILKHTDVLLDIAQLISHGYRRFSFEADSEPKNCVSTLLTILGSGADVNEYNDDGMSVLMVFMRALGRRQRQLEDNQIEECVNLLLEHGANACGTSRTGDTVLHHAVHNGLYPAIEPLIKHKANVNARNSKGLSVMQLLKETMHMNKSNLILFGSYQKCMAILADARAHMNPSQAQASGWQTSDDQMSVPMADITSVESRQDAYDTYDTL